MCGNGLLLYHAFQFLKIFRSHSVEIYSNTEHIHKIPIPITRRLAIDTFGNTTDRLCSQSINALGMRIFPSNSAFR